MLHTCVYGSGVAGSSSDACIGISFRWRWYRDQCASDAWCSDILICNAWCDPMYHVCLPLTKALDAKHMCLWLRCDKQFVAFYFSLVPHWYSLTGHGWSCQEPGRGDQQCQETACCKGWCCRCCVELHVGCVLCFLMVAWCVMCNESTPVWYNTGTWLLQCVHP